MITQLGVYRHWKGNHYRVLFVANDATNGLRGDRNIVIYLSMTDGRVYSRPENEFHELVRRTPPVPTAPCLCDARGQSSCRRHPGDEAMVRRFELTSRTPEM
jgi:hypothetical protein